MAEVPDRDGPSAGDGPPGRSGQEGRQPGSGSGDRWDARSLDAAALKALAHPLRYRLLEQLSAGGAATASELARQVGESSGSTSYHLRRLASQGFIEEATDLGTGRDRWWRAAPGGWTLETLEMLHAGTRDEVAQVLSEFDRARTQRLDRWRRDAERWGERWMDASLGISSHLFLTPAEAAELRDDLAEVAQRWQERVEERRDDPPAGTARVMLQLDLFPTGTPPERTS